MLSKKEQCQINDSYSAIKNNTAGIIQDTIQLAAKSGNKELNAVIAAAKPEDIESIAQGVKSFSVNVFSVNVMLKKIKSVVAKSPIHKIPSEDLKCLGECFMKAINKRLPPEEQQASKAWLNAYWLLTTTIYGKTAH